MTKYRPADFADDETSSMGSIQIGENSNSPSGLHVRFENPGANNHNLHNNSGTLAYLQQQMVSEGGSIYTVDENTRKLSRTRLFVSHFRASGNCGAPETTSNAFC